MKQAGRVRRPFHAQALAIILLCRILVTEFEKESHHTADNVLPLEECVKHWLLLGVKADLVPFS